MNKKESALVSRIEVLEAQQAVMAGFISIVMQTGSHHFTEPERTALRATYEALFERIIAQMLSSNVGFSDAAIHAIEQLKINMLDVIPAHQS